jgi:hypothetical protein
VRTWRKRFASWNDRVARDDTFLLMTKYVRAWFRSVAGVDSQPNSSLTVHTAISIAAMSAVSPAGTAWRVFLMFTAPK